MPRGKKNKGNSGSAPPPNNNNNKLPAEPKAPDTLITAISEPSSTTESNNSSNDLKVRLANAKERLNLLQEVIGGIGDPTDVQNFEASGIDAAKEKLTIIQGSVNAMKNTLLEVRQDAARSITPEGRSLSGTNKRRKNKKHHNQNPPQGFVPREVSAGKATDVTENKFDKEAVRNESSEPELGDGTSTISKKKRNKNKKKKAQQEQLKSDESKLDSQTGEVIAKTDKKEPAQICEPKSDTKENSPDGSKSKNKKNKKKGQQNQKELPDTNDNKVEPAVQRNETQATEGENNEPRQSAINKTPEQETTKGNQADKNQKNKNKKKKGEGNDKCENKDEKESDVVEAKDKAVEAKDKAVEAKDKAVEGKKDVSKIEVLSSENKETKLDNKATDNKVSSEVKETIASKGPDGQSTKPKQETKKEAEKAADHANDKHESLKNKKDKKKGSAVDIGPPIVSPIDEKQADETKNSAQQVPAVVATISSEQILEEKEPDTKTKPTETQKHDSAQHKNKKNKGQITDLKHAEDTKVKEKPQELKEKLLEQSPEAIVPLTEKLIVDVEQLKSTNITTVESPKQETHKNEKDKKKGQAPDSKPVATLDEAEKTESVLATKTPEPEQIVLDQTKQTLEAKNETGSSKTACQKNKKDKNKPATITKIEDHQDEKTLVEVTTKPESAKHSSDLFVGDFWEQKCAASGQKTEPTKEETKGNEQDKKDTLNVTSLEIDPKSPEKQEKLTEAIVAALPYEQIESKIIQKNDEVAVKIVQSVPVPAEETTKIESEMKPAPCTTAPLPKLDFSQVVKENKDKIPLMEVAKVSPVLTATAEGNVEIKEVSEVTTKMESPVPTIPQATPVVEAPAVPKQNKAKTPERKGNQKNEQKKQGSQQGKGQGVKPKHEDQKSQAPKNEKSQTVGDEKIATQSDSVAVGVLPPAETEAKAKDEIRKDQLLDMEKTEELQVFKNDEKKTSAEEPLYPKEIAKEVEVKSELATKLNSELPMKPVEQQKMEKGSDKKTVESVAVAKASEIQDEITKPINPTQTKSTSPRQPLEQLKLDSKAETSKKDQKKQNKTKGKAPQPPDIPMDMSLLSASMIDPPTMDQIVSNEESEDQSSLIASDSKNVEGSDFVQSADSLLSTVTTDGAKSLDTIVLTPKNENKVTDIVRETKNASPTSNKRNKDEANLRQSDEMQESKRQELPEKNAQQKLEPVVTAVKLMDILEAKMTSPAVKPGNIAGNVRKLPKEAKKHDQLKVQQQKSRSKSPKQNMAEKCVKNQKLAIGDSGLSAQNSKTDSCTTEVRSTAPPISVETQEVKESTKTSDVNLSAIENKPGTVPTIVAKTEQVDNLKESDVQSKQIDESLPANVTMLDSKLHKPNVDDETKDVKVAASGKDQNANEKPKILPKPDVSSKPLPKTIGRSKKSPPKTCDTKAVHSTPATSTKSSTSNKTSDQKPTTNKPEIPPKPLNIPKTNPNKISPISSPDEEEEFVEYKFTPRPVFISTICQVCKVPLETFNQCKFCQMVSYCSDEHMMEDQITHGPLCNAVQEIAKKRGGHIYNNARILSDDDYRSLRVHTLNLCESFLKRHLLPFEREILLFPRLCCTGVCREWRQQSLIECKQCGQVSYCEVHPEHLPESHVKWCKSFNLYQKIVLRQKNFGRIEPSLPSKIMLRPFGLPNNIDDVFKTLYKNYGAIKDECIYATLTNLATPPLTVFYGAQMSQQEIGEIYTVHLIGAELQFEADTLDKWETFFLHLVPRLVEFRVVFVGPELNAENLPLEILSRIRMCRTCRQNCRIVKFDFQCGVLYHDYVNSSAFTKPDLICFFNPGLYRSTGFNGLDTWPNTIKSATSMNCPIVVTSYTEVESPRDLERIQKESARPLTIAQTPHINPYASQRPERNFISDEIAPMIFKNFYCFCVK